MNGYPILVLYRHKSLFIWERSPESVDTRQQLQERIHGMLFASGDETAYNEWLSTQRNSMDGILHDARNTRRCFMGPNVSCLMLSHIL